MKRQAKLLQEKEISTKDFRDNLVQYLSKIISSNLINEFIILGREATIYREEEELYQAAIKIFNIKENDKKAYTDYL